jgi:hypothetical protein
VTEGGEIRPTIGLSKIGSMHRRRLDARGGTESPHTGSAAAVASGVAAGGARGGGHGDARPPRREGRVFSWGLRECLPQRVQVGHGAVPKLQEG